MPALGGLTMSARWPLPIGLTRLMSRWLRFFGSVSRLISSSGWTGVRSPKYGPAAGGLGIDAVDGVDPEHAPVLLGLARGADGAGDAVADPESEPADLARADVDVVRARQQAVPAHEAEALVDDVEDAARVGVARALGLALQDLVDEVVLALAGLGVELEVLRDLLQLGDAHLAEIADLEVVALAGGFELLLLFVFGNGGAASASDGIPSARTAVSGTVALVGAWSGHMGRGHLWERAGRLTMRPGSVGAERAMRAKSSRSVRAGRDTWSIDAPEPERQ